MGTEIGGYRARWSGRAVERAPAIPESGGAAEKRIHRPGRVPMMAGKGTSRPRFSREQMAMLGTIVRLICWMWIIEVAAALLMYSWALCKRRRDAPDSDAWPPNTAHHARLKLIR